ncbi:unnamed protein product [Aphanomyces euteiches]
MEDTRVTNAKMSPDGSLAWTDTVESGATEIVGGNVIDTSGNLYVVGSTRGNVSASTCNAGSLDMFLMKLSPTGSRMWTTQIGTPQHDEARHLLLATEVDGNTYLYIAGITYGGLDEMLHVTNGYRQFGGRDIFVMKFTVQGQKLWSRQFGTSADDYTYGLTQGDDLNSISVTGGTRTNVPASNVKFLAVFDAGGNLINHAADGGVFILPSQTRVTEGTPSKATTALGRYTVVLNREPKSNVTVIVNGPMMTRPESNDTISQLQFAPASLVFTSTNWNIPQAVVVSAVDDSICEEMHYATITHSVASSDAHFSPSVPFILGSGVTFTIVDNDRAGIVLSRTNLYAVEGGASDRYGIVLASQPWFNVTVTAVAMRPLQTLLSPSQIVFTPSTWNVTQWITVVANDDSISENEFSGVHDGGAIVHFTQSRDCFYNTRQPSCYYIATCNCSNTSGRGTCSSSQITAGCGDGTPLLVCDIDSNRTSSKLGNGITLVRLNGGNMSAPLTAIPVRYGNAALNPNPPSTTSTSVNSNLETIEVETRYIQFSPPPFDNGWGAVWTTQTILSMDMANPNPASVNISGLVLDSIPADVLGYIYSFASVPNGTALAALAQNQTKLIRHLCLGIQRLTTHRWAFEAWPPGMADRVLDGIFRMLPSLQERQLWNCGLARFDPLAEIGVTIFDNDPAVTMSTPSLQVAEGGAAAQYSIVLSAPPSRPNVGSNICFCDANSTSLNVCRASNLSGFFSTAFSSPASSSSASVTVVAKGSSRLAISPQFLTFTSSNWFIPQFFSVFASDDDVAQGVLNTTITHSVYVNGSTATAAYVNASFWFQRELPLSNSSTLPVALPFNQLPTVFNAPNHRQVQVAVVDNDQPGIAVSKSFVSLKETSALSSHVGDTARGLCIESVMLSPTFGVRSDVLLLSQDTSVLLKFHVPAFHHSAFSSRISSASIVLFRTQYDVVNSSQFNSSNAKALYPTVQLRVALISSNWSEANVTSTPPRPLPIASLDQNVTLNSDFTLAIDVTPFITASQTLHVASFVVTIISDPANLQMYSRAHLENMPPVLKVETQFPNQLLGQPASQPNSTSAGVNSTTDGNVATVGDPISSWWQSSLPTLMPSGTLAIFFSPQVTSGSVDILTSVQPLDPSWNFSTAQTYATALRRLQISRPILLWPIQAAVQYIRIYSVTGASLGDVQFFGPGIALTTTDDGWGLRSTSPLIEPMLSAFDRTSWSFASGANVIDDNLAAGMPTNQSSSGNKTATSLFATAFEVNPWWTIDLGSSISVGIFSIQLERSLDERAACANPNMPVDAPSISNFTAIRLRLSTLPMNATVNTSQEVLYTRTLGTCFPLEMAWSLYTSARYIRVEMVGRGVLSISDVQVRRWSSEIAQYLLLELRGSGRYPIALPAFTFVGASGDYLPYQIHSLSSPQSFNVQQPWGSSCFVATAATYREWIVVDFTTVQQIQSVQMNFDQVSTCNLTRNSTEAPSAISISVYATQAPLNAPSSSSLSDLCSCNATVQSIIIAPPASNCNFCSKLICPTCTIPSFTNATSGVALFHHGFRDIALLVPPSSLPTRDLPLRPTAYCSVLLRDQPLSYWRLQQANADSNIIASQAAYGVSPLWPTGFAVLNGSTGSSLQLLPPPSTRVQWSGQSFLNAEDSSFTIEFWISIPNALAAPVVILTYSAGPSSASIEIGAFANRSSYFTLQYGRIATTVIGSTMAVGSNAWTHVVASYSWGSQLQTLAANGWDNLAQTVQLGQRVQTLRSDVIAMTWTGSYLINPSVPCSIAHIAWYQRALTHHETLDHFLFSTPSRSYATYSIQLTSQPSTVVDVDVVTEVQCYRWGLCNTTAIPPTLRYTPKNWNIPQYVMIHGTDSLLAQGLQRLAIRHLAYSATTSALSVQVSTPVYSEEQRSNITRFYNDLLLNQTVAWGVNTTVGSLFGPAQALWASQSLSTFSVQQPSYSTVSIAPLNLQLQSKSVAAVELSAPYLTVAEEGIQAVFEVALSTEPKSNVSIYFNASTDCYRLCGPASSENPCPVVTRPQGNETQLCNITVLPLSAVFTPATWNIPQTVTVVAVDDYLDEADVHYTSIKTTTSSLDPDYNNLLLPNIRVAVEDNDQSAVVVSTRSLALSEANTTAEANYSLVLTSEPWSEVNISVSNEASNECYRLCGYPIDTPTCGLPRPLAANSISIGTSSVRELQTVTASMTTTNGIQAVKTSTTHIDPIYQVSISGGYVLATWTLQVVFPPGVQYSTSSAYGASFALSLNAASVTTPVDAFGSATQLQSALNVAFGASFFSVNQTRDTNASQLTVSWLITFLSASNVPSLAVATAPLPAVAILNRTSTLQTPSGSIILGYGQTPYAGIDYNATADQVVMYLESLSTVSDATVTRNILPGPTITWLITLTAVTNFFSDLIVDASKLVGARGAASSVAVTWTCLQQPNIIGGWFQLTYPVNASYTASTVPLMYNASESDVVNALSPVPTLGIVQVRRSSLAPELTFEWTIEFAGNVGPVANLTATSLNLTGISSNVTTRFVQQGAALGGSFTLQLGGIFKNTYPSTEVYDMAVPIQTTQPIAFNANASVVQAAILALPLQVPLVGVSVSQVGSNCDVFGRCRQYTWSISYPQTPGNVPTLNGTSLLTGPGAALSIKTISNGTYLSGQFRVSLALNDSGTFYEGTTWPLPVNVTSDGLKEALEAMPFVTSYRQGDSSFDLDNPLAIPKATKGVRVSRVGPRYDGGYTWFLGWSLNDWLRFTDIKINVLTDGITQDVAPPQVATQFGPDGPRCAQYPSTTFQLDPTDSFGLRGFCVYPLAVTVSPERFLCNSTVKTPRPRFDASNWYIPQTIRVSAVRDFLDETTPTTNTTQSTLQHFAYTLDFIYAGLSVPNVTVNVDDVDRAQVLVSKSTLYVSENGSLTDSYLLTLKTEPRANVVIVIYPWLNANNTGCYRFGLCNITLDTTNVTFTPQNWYVPQIVLMRATQDALDEDDVHYSGISHVAFSSDLKYDQIAVPAVQVVIYDDDTSAFIVSKKTLLVEELGRVDQYTIVLTSEPFAKVTVTALSNGTDALGNRIILPQPVVFTWKDWNIPQTMTVQAFHDWTVDQFPHTTLLSHAVATNDLIYIKQPVANLTVFAMDADVAGVVLSQSTLNGTEGSVVSYALRLSSKPWTPVTVAFNASQGCYKNYFHSVCNVSMTTTSVQFTSETWNTWQYVKVAITADRLEETPVHSASIAHAITTTDNWYAVVSPPSMTIYITDVDKSALVVSSTTSNITVAQASFNASYSIALATEPYDYVTVLLSVPAESFVPRGSGDGIAVQEPVIYTTNGSNISQVIQSLIFAPHNWNIAQSVVLSALTTGSPKPLTMQTTIIHRPVSLDVKYNISTPPRLYATVLGREDFPPPIPISASFDSTGVKVVITFDSPVFHAATMRVDYTQSITQITTRYILPSSPFNCSLVWNTTASTGYLGDDAGCLWLDLQTLRIVLGKGATIVPSDRLILQGCAANYVKDGLCTSPFVVKARDFNVLYTTASIAVTVGSVVVSPNIVLVGPKFIGSCGLLTLDATASTGNAQRPFGIQWFAILTSALPAAAINNATAALQAAWTLYASLKPLCASDYDPMTSPSASQEEFNSMCQLRSLAGAATSLTWTLDRSALMSASSYVFGVSLTNFFNKQSVFMQTVQTLDDPVPVVAIAGSTVVSQYRTQPVSLMAAVKPVSLNCTTTLSSSSKVQYRWVVEAPTSAAVVNTAVDARTFSVPANTLQAGVTYRLRVDAFYSAQSTLKTSDWANITIVPSNLVAQIVGGDHVIGSADTLVVNASLSYDPDQIPVPLTYRWTCRDITPTNSSTANIASQPCINPQTNLPIDFSQANESILTLPSLTYQPSKVLNFTVTVVQNCSATTLCSNTRVRSTSVSITTVDGRIPIVKIEASLTRVNPSTKVLFSSSVTSLYPYKTMWSQDQGDLVLSGNGTNSTSSFLLPLSNMQNALSPNVLTPGKTYIFRLTATDSNGAQGFGTVTITVNSPPTPGTFRITPLVGTAIVDQFTLLCENWSDQDQPLQYSFYKVDSVTGSLVPLVASQTLPSAQTRLYISSNTTNTNETVQVLAMVTDALGATTNLTTTATVVQPVVSDPIAFWTQTSNSTLSDALNSGNLNDAMTVLMSTTAFLQAKGTCTATSCGPNGQCNNVTNTCVCSGGYAGSTCSIPPSAVDTTTAQMLSSLASLSTAVDLTPTTLTQSVLTISNIVSLNEGSSMAPENVAAAAVMLQNTTASMLTQADPTSLVNSVGSTLLSATGSLLQSTNTSTTTGNTTTTGRRRLTAGIPTSIDGNSPLNAADTTSTSSSSLMQALFYVAAMSSANLLAGEPPVNVDSASVSSFSVVGSSLSFAMQPNNLVSTIRVTPVAEKCIGDSYFVDAITWTRPIRALLLPKDTPALTASVTIAIHTNQALLQARYQGSALNMLTLPQNDPCVAMQKTDNTDAKLPLVTIKIAHPPLNKGQRFSTACRSWNSSSSSWDSTICTKDTLNSTTTSTTCSCVSIGGLEVAVVSEENLTFVPANPTVYRNDPSSVVPPATIAVLLAFYAWGIYWGRQKDKDDKDAVRLKRLGMLSKATWKELLQHESTKATTALRDLQGPQLQLYQSNTVNAFMTTFRSPNNHEAKPANTSDAMAVVVAENDAINSLATAALNENALFGTLRLQSQHVLLRRSLQAVNWFLILVSIVFVAIGVDFIYVLGNTSHSVALVLYGPTVGTYFLFFGEALAVIALLGLLAATHNTSGRLRTLYMLGLFLLVVGECILLAVANYHLVEVDMFPAATQSYLQTIWKGLSSSVRADVQTRLGCCGFASITDNQEIPCPEEALVDPLSPRTCFAAMTFAASSLFHNVFSSILGVVIAQVVALGIANVLVRWEAIRIYNLSHGYKKEETLFVVVLRSGLDVLFHWVFLALSSATVFVKVELGIPLVTLNGLYFLLNTVGGWALSGIHIRPMKGFAIGHIVLLTAGVCLAIMLSTFETNLPTYTTLQTMLEARYVALSPQDKVELETNFMCCGYSVSSQGTCTNATTTLPLCGKSITLAVQQLSSVTLDRLTTFLLSQLALLVTTGIFLSYQSAITPSTSQALSPQVDEFTDVTSVVINRVSAQILLLASIIVAFCGAILVAVGCDLLLQTNLVTISAVLNAFSTHAGTYILILGAVLVAASGIGIFGSLTRRKKWLWGLAVVLLGATTASLALYAAAYRIQNPANASIVNATMLSTWTAFAPATKQFVQNAYTCCGFSKVLTDGVVSYTLPYLKPTWSNAMNMTSVSYTPECPSGASSGCGSFMIQALIQAANATTTTAMAVCALFSVVFVATGVLYYRQGKKKPVTWMVLISQTAVLAVGTGVGVSLLGLGLIGLDVAAGTTVFTSNVIQTIFGQTIGVLVILFVTYAIAVTSYGLYGAINKILHVILIFLGLASGLALLGWSSVGIVGSMASTPLSWQSTLDDTLDRLWTKLSFDSRMFIAVSRQCCGFKDPTLVGQIYSYDRATSADGLTLACPSGLSTGCRKILLQDAAALLAQLFNLLVAFSTLETCAVLLAIVLLRGLITLHHDVWIGIVKKMRWWVAKYSDDVKVYHMALSLQKHYDAKFTRPQRLTCILCAVVAMTLVDASVQATYGCNRTSSMDCQPYSAISIVLLGLLYSLVSLVVQIMFVAAFTHIRHRQDEVDSATLAEHKRKEKVYFREVMQQSLHSLMSKFGHLSMVTSEERFYSWLIHHVDWITFLLCWARLLFSVAIGVYMVLGGFGLGFYMFDMQVPGSVDFIVVPVVMILSSGGVLLCTSLRQQKVYTRIAHVGLLVATISSIVLVAILSVVIFLIFQALEDPTTPRNWTQRSTGFCVVDALRAIWMNDTSGVLRQQWQTQLNCCGLPDFPVRPCPQGPSYEQNVTATKVDGTTIFKTVTVVQDLGGCLDKMLGQVRSVAQTLLFTFVIMIIVELIMAACTYFLARDIVISWDTKVRRLSMKKEKEAEEDMPFDLTPSAVAAPQRGRITSTLVQTSIDNVSTAVAAALAETPVPHATRRQPMQQDKIKQKLKIRYPAWITKVVYATAALWTAGCVFGTIFLALDLSDYAALPWLVCVVISLVLHAGVIEPAYVFAIVVSKTLHSWWKHTWMAALIGMGKAILHLDEGADDAATILDPFMRIRHNAAIVIQRRWMTKLARLRYLVILRVARETAHRVAIETRIRTIKDAIAGFTRDETEAFIVLFKDADHAKTGLVSYKIVSQAVYALGVKVPSAVVKQYLLALDPGFDELIDLDYFLYAMSCIRGYHQDQQRAQTTTDELVVSSSLEGKIQVKKQNMLRELKDKRTAISKHLMSKVEKLASKLRVDTTEEDEEVKPSGAYVLLNTKKNMGRGGSSPTRPGTQSTRQKDSAQPPSPTNNAAPVAAVDIANLQLPNDDVAMPPREQVLPAIKPPPKAMLSMRATKDMEKAIEQMKLKQKSKKK